MNILNNTFVATVVGTLLAVSVLLSTTKAFATSITNQLTGDKVEQVMKKGPQLVIMWSLDCPACFYELDSIAQLLKQHPSLPITLISTDDDPSLSEEISEVYAEPAFNQISRLVYSPNQGQQLRYAIDSTWQGELPRSYYIDQNAKSIGHSGLLTPKQLKAIIDLIK